MISITSVDYTGDVTSGNLFQTNLLQTVNTGTPNYSVDEGNPDGIPTATTLAAMAQFGITQVRYPGGQPDVVYADGMIQNGGLPPTVATFLDFAMANGLTVNMVVPVDPPAGQTSAQFAADLETFASLVAQTYPGVVPSYELGNEYWAGRAAGDASLDAQYGHDAGVAAAALNAGLNAAATDADIYLQAAGNLRGAYGNDLETANGEIRDAFAAVPGAMDAIDGVTRNFYWMDAETDGFENDSGVFNEDRDLNDNVNGEGGSWDTWAGRDLKAAVGEYNVTKNLATGDDAIDIGINGASFYLEHFTNLVDAGVETAYIWPIVHNTQNAIVHKDEAITTSTVHGFDILTNSTRGAMADLLSKTVDSHELVDIGWSDANATGVELTAFEDASGASVADGTERILFISSRSDVPQTIDFEIGGFVSTYANATGIRIGYEGTDANHRDALVTELDPAAFDGGVLNLTLSPYEVIQLIFEVPDVDGPAVSSGPTAGDDVLVGTDGADWIEAQDGDDIVTLGDGDDEAYGDAGNDVLNGEGGVDRLFGGEGHDTVDGGAGDDWISGSSGNDVVNGGSGNDHVMGSTGHDTVSGGGGSDTVSGGWGNDQVFGDAGHDTLTGGFGDDTLDGGTGNDELFGEDGADILWGGLGRDNMTGGAGNDIYHFAEFDSGFDKILDFTKAEDLIRFGANSVVADISDLAFVGFHSGNSTLIRFRGDNGAIDKSLGGILVEGVAISEGLNQSDFLFG